mmetsp:Transcript_37007/g.92910  ORF Transcript_37007/g.92910 Transcript_37007/m.92910 type:complete len:233 (+) Transcript_37007:1392-2090(+)
MLFLFVSGIGWMTRPPELGVSPASPSAGSSSSSTIALESCCCCCCNAGIIVFFLVGIGIFQKVDEDSIAVPAPSDFERTASCTDFLFPLPSVPPPALPFSALYFSKDVPVTWSWKEIRFFMRSAFGVAFCAGSSPMVSYSSESSASSSSSIFSSSDEFACGVSLRPSLAFAALAFSLSKSQTGTSTCCSRGSDQNSPCCEPPEPPELSWSSSESEPSLHLEVRWSKLMGLWA